MKLKQLASINAGYPFRGKIPEVVGSSVVVVQMKDASPADGIRWSSCLETRLTGKRQPDYLSPGDILVAARGNHNYAVSVDHTLVTTGKQAVAAPHFFVISLKTKDVLPEFMVWLFNQGPVQRYFEQNAEGTLTKSICTKSIRRSVLEDAPVVIPPLAKQRAILGMAKTLAEEQKLVQTLINNGERMMATIAKDLFNSV